MSGEEADPELQSRIAVFRQTLGQHGWSEGRNIGIDIRFAGIRTDQYRALAKEIVTLKPDAHAGGRGVATAKRHGSDHLH
jgi:hypothetical protein